MSHPASLQDVNPYEPAIIRQLEKLQTNPLHTEIVKSARRIFGWLSPTNDAQSTLNRFLAATTPIVAWAVKSKHHEAVASNLTSVLSHLYVMTESLQESEQTIQSVVASHTLNAGTALLPPARQALRNHCISALDSLYVTYLQRRLSLWGVDKYIPNTSNWGNPDEMNRRADEVAEKIDQCRMYGVKSCIMEDGILHAPGTTWVFLDGEGDHALLPIEFRQGMRAPLASTRLTKKGDVTSFKSVVRNSGPRGNITCVESPYKRLFCASIQTDGTLTADGTYGLWPLEDIFREAGKEEVYPAFRLAHLLRLCDLIVPETLQRQYDVPAWPTIPKGRTERDSYRKSLPEQFRRLQIPRIRMLEDPEAVKNAQTQELKEDQAFTAHSTRQAPEHVTWFWRRLPRGHKASPEALERSKQDRGKLPPEGYTYVAERGTAPGHKASRRNQTLE